jgi:arginine-tRNA-protein transferase
MIEPQKTSHWPTWPLPILRQVTMTGKSPCGYLPGHIANFRAFDAEDPHHGMGLTGEGYQHLMDAGFRRSGTIVYQPICAGCRSCIPIRVPVDCFRPSRSQRRVLRQNKSLHVHVARPEATREKWELYDRYQREWHRKVESDRENIEDFVTFLYRSPVESLEFEYRDPWGKLLGVGICDVTPKSVSSVYFYFDPSEAWRSVGTFSAIYEIQWAKQMGLAWWYAGYFVDGCAAMEYKARFRPLQVLGTDGMWRDAEHPARKPVPVPV